MRLRSIAVSGIFLLVPTAAGAGAVAEARPSVSSALQRAVPAPGVQRVSVRVLLRGPRSSRRRHGLRLRVEDVPVVTRTWRVRGRRAVRATLRAEVTDGVLDVRWRALQGRPRVVGVDVAAVPVPVPATAVSPGAVVPPAGVGPGEVERWRTTTQDGRIVRALAHATLSPGAPADGTPRLAVDATSRLQPVEGFGGAMTESAAHLIDRSPERDRILEQLYGPAGAGHDVVRVVVGASDMARDAYSYDDTCCELSDFSIARDLEHVVPVLQRARALNPGLRIVAAPWSAPGWMKSGGTLRGSCWGDANHLRDDRYGVYADYLVRFVGAYAAHGLPVDALSLQNEPEHCAGDYPTMTMSPAEQAALSVELRAALDAAGFPGVAILGWDHNWYQRGAPAAFPHELLSRPGHAVDGIAYHCYESPEGAFAVQSDLRQAFPTTEIHFTECVGGGWSTDEAANLVWNLRNTLIGPLRHWARSSLYWSLALDPAGGPHSGGCPNCRGMVTVDAATGAHRLNGEHHAWAHLAKVVRPGAVRIASEERPQEGLHTVAFANADGTQAIVVLNASWDAERSFHVDAGPVRFADRLGPASVASYLWSPGT